MPRLFDVTNVDANTRVYHSSLRLLEGWQVQGGMKGVTMISFNGEQQPICAVLEILLSLPGVTHAQVKAYEATVVKSPLWDWDEIEKDLAELWLGIPVAVTETTPDAVNKQRFLMKLRDNASWSILDSKEKELHEDAKDNPGSDDDEDRQRNTG